MPDRYLELNDDVGLDADGNPEPLVKVGVAVSVPQMKGGEVVGVDQRVEVEPIAGTRTIKTDDPRVAGALLGSGQYHEVDPPGKKGIQAQRDDTQDAREAAGTHDEGQE